MSSAWMFGESGVPGAMPAGGSARNRRPQQAQRPPRSSIRVVCATTGGMSTWS